VKLIEKTEVVRRPGHASMKVTAYTWDFTEEVGRGAEWLDRTLGADWWHDLELDALNLNSGLQCVLGQLAMTRFREQLIEFGTRPCDCGDPECREEVSEDTRFEYNDVTKMLVETEGVGWAVHASGLPGRFGFFVNDAEARELLDDLDIPLVDKEQLVTNDSWEHLTWAWTDEIRARQLAEKKAADEAADRLLDALLNEESKEMEPA
jgi:hypothetical protein